MQLKCQGVSYRYQKQSGSQVVLNTIDFEAQPGQFWAILGPNGAGKSTFLKLISGLLPTQHFSTGQVEWNQTPLRSWNARTLAQKVVYVPSALKNSFPVRVLDFILQGRFSHQKVWQTPTSADFQKAEEALAYFGIQNVAQSFLDQVSSGEQQLALLARAFVQNPEVLILDESMSGVDFSKLAGVFKKLLDWNKRKKLTIFWATHDLNLAAEVCSHFAWMVQGRLEFTGLVEEAFAPQQLQKIFGDALHVSQSPKTLKPQVFLKL